MTAPLPPVIPVSQQVIALLWPSFVIAIVASGVFFSAFDPRDLVPFNLDIDLSPLAAYTIGFFLFWLIGLLSSLGTLYLALVNSRTLAERGS